MKPADWIIILIAGTAFGAPFGLNELLLREIGPLTISALHIGIAALGCWAWMLTRPNAELARANSTPRLTLLGLFQFTLVFALLPYGQMHITSSVAGIANALTSFATLDLSIMLVTGECVTSAKSLGPAFGAMCAVAPVSSLGIGALFFDEALTIANFTGVVLILLGLCSIDRRILGQSVYLARSVT